MGHGETNEQLGKGERAAQKVETHPTYVHLASNDELAMNSRVKPLPLLGRFDTPSPSAPLALMMFPLTSYCVVGGEACHMRGLAANSWPLREPHRRLFPQIPRMENRVVAKTRMDVNLMQGISARKVQGGLKRWPRSACVT